MSNKIGLWIDHRQAVIVNVTDEGEGVKRITSHMEKDVRFSSRTADIESPEDVRDRQFENHLNKYYNDVIGSLRNAESILIFGPGEAKGELEKRLAGEGLKERIVGVETVDKMTDSQIAAKVRQHFLT